jgi:hypothetical protein
MVPARDESTLSEAKPTLIRVIEAIEIVAASRYAPEDLGCSAAIPLDIERLISGMAANAGREQMK